MEKINFTKYISEKRYLTIFAISEFFLKAVVILIPLLTERIVDSSTSHDFFQVIKYGVFSVIASICFIALMFITAKSQIVLYSEIDYRIKSEIARKIVYGEYQKVSEHDVGAFLQRHDADIREMRFLYFEKNIDLVINIIYFTALFISMMYISVKATLVLLVSVPIFIWANHRFIPKLEEQAAVYLNSEERLNSSLEMLYKYSHAIRAERCENQYYAQYHNANQTSAKNMRSYYVADEKYNSLIINGILNLCNCSVYFIGGLLVLQNEVSVGALLAMAIYFGRLWSPVEFFLGYRKKVSKARVSEKRIAEILTIPENSLADLSVNRDQSLHEIRFEDVNASFDGHSVIHNFSYSFQTGKRYLVTGQNGSGKTTLMNLLSGVYESEFHVFADHIPVSDAEKKAFLHQNIYFMPSELFLNEDETACSRAAQGDIQNRKDEISENGITLSSGEKRLMQLRQLKNREEKMLMIDEPTNFISKTNKVKVINLIKEISADHIVVIASHDPDISDICDEKIAMSREEDFS